MLRRVLALALIGLVGCATPAVTSLDPPVGNKVWVCKYVGTPGVDERLQTGQNPISVSVNSIPDPEGDGVHVGDEFTDAQGRSLVIAFDDGGPEPPPECPEPNNTTTTTTTTEVTTSTSTTTPTTSSSTTSTTTTSTIPSTTSSSTSTTTTSSSTTTSTTTPPTTSGPPVLTVDFLTPICDGDVPYLTYSASFDDATRVARITFVNPDGPDVTYTDLPLSGRVLWPGAVVDAEGNPVDWPGWILLPDGTWVEGDDGFLWVRPSVTVELEINPTVTAEIGYPPATPLCDANPPDNPPTTTTTAPPTTTTAPPVTTIPGLPVTR